MDKKGIVLFSGGLDSMLAALVLREQGLDLTAVRFLLPFESETDHHSEQIHEYARFCGVPLRVIDCSSDFIPMLKDPKHGYGKNINPCIDCKILFQRLALTIMHEEGASFIATGEVSGQRPMSQRRDMIKHIEKEAGTAGYILRPLSIRFFDQTLAEKEGIVDRSRLLSIHGRGRHLQLELAKKYGITTYATPAGGCLFTESNYARKLKYLMEHEPGFDRRDMQLLRIGRHFILNSSCRILVTRNKTEAEAVQPYLDYAVLTTESSFKGPLVLGFGSFSRDDMQRVADIAGTYGKTGSGSDTVTVRYGGTSRVLTPSPLSDTVLNSFRI
ncbi:MAG: tRNA 4-thiouridine(8) synthase ThiI [Spirochaetota bacterium]